MVPTSGIEAMGLQLEGLKNSFHSLMALNQVHSFGDSQVLVSVVVPVGTRTAAHQDLEVLPDISARTAFQPHLSLRLGTGTQIQTSMPPVELSGFC